LRGVGEEELAPYLGDERPSPLFDPLFDPLSFRGCSWFSNELRASVLFVLIDCAETESNAVRPYSTPDKYPDKCIKSLGLLLSGTELEESEVNNPELAHFGGLITLQQELPRILKGTPQQRGTTSECQNGHSWHIDHDHLIASLNQCPRHPLSLGRDAVGRSSIRRQDRGVKRRPA
jgi:hypothetical protein